MKFLFDFFPILLFFVAFKMFDIYVATGVAIVATFVQIGYYWFRHRKVETMHVVTLVLISVFGGATIYLHDPIFIKWKVTLVNWIFALAFLGSHFFGEKTLTQRMMGGAITLKVDIWGRLNLAWVAFFFSLGLINLYVMYNFDEATWVNFKLFGMMGLTFAFVILQAIYMSPYIETEQNEKE